MSTTDQLLHALQEEAANCRDCDLWAHATQTVFGDGSPDARLILIGEQPGNEEDLTGEPFVGPAGRLLQDALADADVGHEQVYLTNAVKHFKWKARGKRRLHQRPNRTEIVACHQWLDRELDLFDPDAVIVALGATAGQALFGPAFRVGKARGTALQIDSHPVVATIHPSAVLRTRDSAERAEAFAGLVDDLRRAAQLAE